MKDRHDKTPVETSPVHAPKPKVEKAVDKELVEAVEAACCCGGMSQVSVKDSKDLDAAAKLVNATARALFWY